MRAYRFLNAEYGLDSLKKRRLKQSRICDLNDPFELTPYDLADPVLRQVFHKTRDDVDKVKGLVCFSGEWGNPLLWAHYSEKQTGLCLGFEIQGVKGDPESDETDHVKYVEKPLTPPTNFDALSDSEFTAFVRKALFTKFNDWDYEKEIRLWNHLQNEESGLYFLKFDEDKLRLTDVIIGQQCPLSRDEIVEALGSLAGEVKISKARAAYDRFEMVEDEQGP
jgi:hypothetical protein